jgi:hypothetical protein
LFAEAAGRPLLFARGTLADRAVGEEVEIVLGGPDTVAAQTVMERVDEDGARHYRLTVTNSKTVPVPFEAELHGPGETMADVPLERRAGRPLWRTTVPANSTATFTWRTRFPTG